MGHLPLKSLVAKPMSLLQFTRRLTSVLLAPLVGLLVLTEISRPAKAVNEVLCSTQTFRLSTGGDPYAGTDKLCFIGASNVTKYEVTLYQVALCLRNPISQNGTDPTGAGCFFLYNNNSNQSAIDLIRTIQSPESLGNPEKPPSGSYTWAYTVTSNRQTYRATINAIDDITQQGQQIPVTLYTNNTNQSTPTENRLTTNVNLYSDYTEVTNNLWEAGKCYEPNNDPGSAILLQADLTAATGSPNCVGASRLAQSWEIGNVNINDSVRGIKFWFNVGTHTLGVWGKATETNGIRVGAYGYAIDGELLY